MTGQLHDAAPVTGAARRADYGAVRLGRRDIDGLILCAEHYGAPYDLLAAALGAQPARLRGIVARWRRAGYAATGRLGPGPAWCWLTPAGMNAAGFGYPATRPSLARLAHIRAVLAARLWLAASPAWAQGRPWWHSERRIRAARPGPAGSAGHLPDAEIHWPSTEASPYPGQVWAVEVELTPKPLARTTAIMAGLLGSPARLQEHSLAGWNIGFAPYGYLADRIPHPAPAKAAQGRTKSRLILDPVRHPVVAQIYTWRVDGKLSVRAITARLNADPAAYPTPDGKPGWNAPGVAKILANPKYTGHMVYGRTRKHNGTKRPVPADQWIWTPEPTRPPIIDRATWDAAQKTGAERGNVRDAETPTARPGRRYILRSRIRHNACQRRMCGTWRTSGTGATYIYYRCPHDPANPRQAAAYPDHGSVSLSETALMTAIAGFFGRYVFGHDRAALLAAQLPATSAEHAEARARQDKHLHAELARIDTAERALISELEQPADPADPGLPGPHPRPLRRTVRPAHPHRNPAQNPQRRRTAGQRPDLA